MNTWIRTQSLNICHLETLTSPLKPDSTDSISYKIPNYHTVLQGATGENYREFYVTYYEYYRVWFCEVTINDYNYDAENFPIVYGSQTINPSGLPATSASSVTSVSHKYLIVSLLALMMVLLMI